MNQTPVNFNPNAQNYSVPSRIYIKGGEPAAMGYLVQKNTEQVLWDSDIPVIYIKSVDAFGNVKLTTLDYTIRPTVEEVAADETKALRNEVNNLRNDIQNMMEQIKEMANNQNNYKTTYNSGNRGGNNK